MLTAYLQQTRRLLNDENAQFYSDTDLTAFINIARNTIATQSECLVSTGTLSTVNGTQSYALTTLTPPTGLSGAVNVRSIMSVISNTYRTIPKRSWQWFTNYNLNGASTTATGIPTVWSMQNEGSMGTVWFSPVPNGVISMSVEAAWTPVALVNDSTPENLSYPWTDAVPYFACYMAYLNAQRQADSQRMLGLFNGFMKAARVGVTPEWASATFPNLKGLQGAFDPLASNIGKAIAPSQGGEGSTGS